MLLGCATRLRFDFGAGVTQNVGAYTYTRRAIMRPAPASSASLSGAPPLPQVGRVARAPAPQSCTGGAGRRGAAGLPFRPRNPSPGPSGLRALWRSEEPQNAFAPPARGAAQNAAQGRPRWLADYRLGRAGCARQPIACSSASCGAELVWSHMRPGATTGALPRPESGALRWAITLCDVLGGCCAAGARK